MTQSLDLVALVVADYDEAIAYYVDTLGFTLVEDSPVPAQGKRWVVVAPPGGRGARLLLARAANDAQAARIGNQTGGRVFLFLHSDDFARDHERYRSRGVEFVSEPRHEPYGIVAVFRDRYGNLWDLIGAPRQADPGALVREFWSRMQGNDFASVAALLGADFVLEWPQSNERIRGAANFVQMNQEYPSHGPWRTSVNRLVAEGDEVVSDVSVSDGVQHARAISFFDVAGGLIRRIVEYWPDPFEAPAHRKHLVEPLA